MSGTKRQVRQGPRPSGHIGEKPCRVWHSCLSSLIQGLTKANVLDFELRNSGMLGYLSDMYFW